MIVFAVYAVFSWYLAAKWRRTWKGFLSQAVSVGLLLLAMRFFMSLGRHDRDDPGRYGSMFLLLGFESAVVALVGFLICCIPRTAPTRRHCAECHYDLTGLKPVEGADTPVSREVLCCPECGTPWHEPDPREGLIPIPKGRPLRNTRRGGEGTI